MSEADTLLPPKLDGPYAPVRKFRPDVEGLRAVAVGLVVLFHAGVPGISAGFVGVDVFFVISGFLITGLLLAEHATKGRISVLAFYARRARRILPAATLVLVTTVVGSYVWLGFLRADTIAEDSRWTAGFMANLHFASEGTQYFNANTPPSPLQHYWSLSVEEQFYVVWPLLIAFVAALRVWSHTRGRLIAVTIAVLLMSLTWSIVQTRTNGTWAYFSPLTRAWELATGSLVAMCLPALRRLPHHSARILSWVGLGGVVASAFVLNSATPFPGVAAVLPVASAALILVGGTAVTRGGAESVLGHVTVQFVGRISYSLYLWHWPLLIIATQHSRAPLGGLETTSLIALAVVLATATFWMVERPVRNSRALQRRPRLSVSLGALVIAASVTFATIELAVHPRPPRVTTTALTDTSWPGAGNDATSGAV